MELKYLFSNYYTEMYINLIKEDLFYKAFNIYIIMIEEEDLICSANETVSNSSYNQFFKIRSCDMSLLPTLKTF